MPNPISQSEDQPAKYTGPLAQSGLWWCWLAVLAIGLDQVTKFVAASKIEYGQHIEVLPIFTLTHVYNYGSAFSFLSDAGGWQRYFLTVVALFISGLLLFWLRQTAKTSRLLCCSYSLILGGAIGNIIDRVAYGYVIDFIHFYYQSWSFPVFNVADMAITLGAALLVIDAFRSPK